MSPFFVHFLFFLWRGGIENENLNTFMWGIHYLIKIEDFLKCNYKHTNLHCKIILGIWMILYITLLAKEPYLMFWYICFQFLFLICTHTHAHMHTFTLLFFKCRHILNVDFGIKDWIFMSALRLTLDHSAPLL